MIRGIDFYNYCMARIKLQENFTVVCKKVEQVFSTHQKTGVIIDGVPIHCTYVFNSILFHQPVLSQKQFWLLQHFKGWIVETVDPVFDPASATFMDFRLEQKRGTSFCYVLPFAVNKALVEYTVFSKNTLPDQEYDQQLNYYLRHTLGISNYSIESSEFGVIPMTNYPFTPWQNNLVNIGTAGGQTKGSSGFTFHFIQKHSAAMVKQLIRKKNPFVPNGNRRFAFYDSVLLNILAHEKVKGSEVFTLLFKRNDPQKILKFLDNESSLLEEIRIISALPKGPFLKAALWQIT